MTSTEEKKVKEILGWCSSVVGPCHLVSGDTRFHGRTLVWRLQTSSGHCYAKIHHQKSSWETEVHGYEQWAQAFGGFVPKLFAVHEKDPLALLVSELPGQIMEHAQLSVEQERIAWRTAGSMLAELHEFAVGECFGPCRRDGTCIGTLISDAVEYISTEFERLTESGVRAGYLNEDELAIISTAQDLSPAFAGERPVPCHRDYGPANWLITSDGVWAGLIDFEFAYWDVRVADFSRYPGWEWIRRPDLLEAFFDGYGRSLTPSEEQQRLVAYTQYALGAIVWGGDHSFYGFMDEGRQALRRLANLLR